MKKKPTYDDLLARIGALEAENRRQSDEIHRQSDEIHRQSDENKQMADEIQRKSDRIAYLERLIFGSKRDKLAKHLQDGPGLFDELFDEAYDDKVAEIAKVAKEIEAQTQERRKRTKKQPNRPSKYRYIGLEERVTTLLPEGVDAGEYDVIGKDVTRILHREPAKVWVEVIERPVLRHKDDKNVPSPRIVQAPAPEAIIGGNHVGADMLSQLVIDKFVYHIPEYRQVKQYADMGVTLPTSTINDWVHAVADKLYPLYEALGEDIRSREYLQIDEVPWRIADTPGKTRRGYAWQFFDATPDSHGLYFYYDKGSRGGAIPRAQLRRYRGAIQTDGYGVYDYFEMQDGVTLLGCMAHVRRKFIEAQNTYPKLAAEATRYIQLLYELEANLRADKATAEQIAAERRAKALPIMDAMEKWMEHNHILCTPGDLLGKAIDYAYKLWPRLRRYAENGIYQIDNNPVERHQRPSVMGRKNYLFSKNDRGAEDNAVFYSLLESCHVVRVNPLEWLIHTLNALAGDIDEDKLKMLLPYNYKKSRE